MKRALAVFAIFGVVGFAGLAQFTGKWEAELQILPAADVGINSTSITLDYTFADWTLGMTASYNYIWGFDDLTFKYEGSLGPADLDISMTFVPSTKRVALVRNRIWDANLGLPGHTNLLLQYYPLAWFVNGPAYYSLDLSSSMDFAGVNLGLDVSHTVNYVYKVAWEDFAAWSTANAAKFDLVTDTWAVVLNGITLDPDGPGATPNGNEVELPYKFIVYHGTTFPDPNITLGFDADAEAFLDVVWDMLFDVSTYPTPVSYDGFIDTDDVEVWFLLPVYMEYTLTASVDPVSLEVVFDDVCTGIQFKEATLTFSELSLCCGVTYDLAVTFTKAGFDKAVFSLSNIGFVCCGITMDVDVEFGTTYKEVSLSLEMVPESLCADVTFGTELETGEDWEILGFSIDYIGISCEFAECLSFFSGTAFVSDDLEYLGLTWADDDGDLVAQYDDEPAEFPYIGVIFDTDIADTPVTDWELASGSYYEVTEQTGSYTIGQTTYVYEYTFDLYLWQEFEYVELSFCGPGCCGGNYEVKAYAYWAMYWLVEGFIDEDVRIAWGDPTIVFPTIFGLSRIGVETTIPVFEGLEFTLDFEYHVFLETIDLKLGWSFTF